MVLCIHCNKTINTILEKYSIFGMDGDFIHKDCKKGQQQQMDRICTMTDEEFLKYMKGYNLI